MRGCLEPGGAPARGSVEAKRNEDAATVGVCDADTASVVVDRLLDDREAQSGAGEAARGCGTVEAIEDVREIGRLDTRAVVADRDQAARASHLDGGARGAPLDRVVEHVVNRPLEPGRGGRHGV